MGGSVKSCGKEFGFLICEELAEQVGKDIFVRSNLLEGFQVGDWAEFAVIVNKHHKVQAVDLLPASQAQQASWQASWAPHTESRFFKETQRAAPALFRLAGRDGRGRTGHHRQALHRHD